MYHVTVRNSNEIIAEEILDGFAEAVSFGLEESVEGNSIRVYYSMQDACGQVLDLDLVLSMKVPKGNHNVVA